MRRSQKSLVQTAQVTDPSPGDAPRMRINGEPVRWQTICELLLDDARHAGPEAGVEIGGVFLDFKCLRLRAEAVACGLQARGVGSGDRVCTLSNNAIEVLLTWFGSALTGAVWVPLNAGLVGEDLAGVLSTVGPALVVADAENAPKLGHPAVQPHLPCHRFVSGGVARDFEPFEALPVRNRPVDLVTVQPFDPAVIIFTGGTTGLPKGVVLPHFACLAAGYRYAEAFGAAATDRHYGTAPLFHAGGLFVGVLGPMIAGMRTTIDRRFSASAYWRRVRETGATIISPASVIMTFLCRLPPNRNDRDHTVRAALGVTGQLPPDVPGEFTRRFGIPLLNIYALSESSGAMTVYNPIGSPKPGSNGRSSHWVEVAVVDALGQPQPPGSMGRIVLRPRIPHTFMLGYHNAPKETLRAFSGLWLQTGDLGYLDEDGYLYFRGREAHWLRRRGENISVYEVEGVLSACPGVAEAAVIGVPVEIGEEEVKAFVVPSPGAEIDPVELVYWCADRLAAFKVPRFVEFVESLPRSPAKAEVERHVLRQRSNAGAWDREAAFGRRLPKRPTAESGAA